MLKLEDLMGQHAQQAAHFGHMRPSFADVVVRWVRHMVGKATQAWGTHKQKVKADTPVTVIR